MAPPEKASEPDEKYRYLWACLMSAMENGGKIDFHEVATTMGVTVNAVRKRFARVKKQMGDPDDVEEDGEESTSPKKAPKTPRQAKGTTKIKEDGDDEPSTPVKPKRKAAPKSKKRKIAEVEKVKEEPEVEEAPEVKVSMVDEAPYGDTEEDESVVDEEYEDAV